MISGGILESMPGPELIGHVLNLSLPELSDVMQRYATPEPAPPQSVVRGSVALVVERPGFSDQRLKDALASEGWTVSECSGPSGTLCPLMRGEPCKLRESADAAIVYVDRGTMSSHGSALPRLRCASHPASPGVVAVEGSIQSAAFADHTATVGGLRDPKTIIDTVARLLLSKITPGRSGSETSSV